jgi:hypothetical protein
MVWVGGWVDGWMDRWLADEETDELAEGGNHLKGFVRRFYYYLVFAL